MRPPASISLDLDNQWSYMKTHGDPGWERYPSYLDIVVPAVLDRLDRLNLKITFFIVGMDASLEKNRAVLRQIADRGHDIGNHSFHHEPWMIAQPKQQIQKELRMAEESITDATGRKPAGFRGPGFVWNRALLEVLAESGYRYDASTLPTYLAPLARAYYFWTSDLTREEKKARKAIFGSLRDGARPVGPYYWAMGSRPPLLEIPVTTVPVIKTPFHLSYLLFLSRFSIPLMSLYLQAAIAGCRLNRTSPSFLLHPLDFISGDRVPELKFFPGMDVSEEKKIRVFHLVVRALARHYELVDMQTHAAALHRQHRLRTVAPGRAERFAG